jgi:hypothetical protein
MLVSHILRVIVGGILSHLADGIAFFAVARLILLGLGLAENTLGAKVV